MKRTPILAVAILSACLSTAFSQKKNAGNPSRFNPERTIQQILNSPSFARFKEGLSKPRNPHSQATFSLNDILKHTPGRNMGTNGVLGDPTNLVFIGTEDHIRTALTRAGWTEITLEFWPAAGLGLKEVLEDGVAPKHFPMSTYFVNGRTQYLNWADAQSLQTRHHFRLWKTDWHDQQKRHVWWGSANFDDGIRWKDLSHKADPDVDKERTHVQNSLAKILGNETTSLISVPQIPPRGTNDRGYPFYTDRQALVIVFH